MDKFYDIISYPFGLVLSFLYNLLNDNYLLALVVFTILAKLILLPGSIKTQKMQATTLRTRSKIEKIRKKYANDQMKMNEEIQAFYEKEGYGSMTAGCGTLLIQFPIIMGLYGAIYKPLSYIIRLDTGIVKSLTDGVKQFASSATANNTRLLEMSVLSNVDKLEAVVKDVPAEVFEQIRNFDFTAFGYDLGAVPIEVKGSYIVVPIVAFLGAMLNSIYSFVKSKKTNPEAANNPTMGCMLLFMPFMSLWLAFQFPVGIGVYWILNSVLGFLQIVILNHVYEPKKVISRMMVEETNVRRSKEKLVKDNVELLKGNNPEKATD